jgi:hypothetical protein
MRAIPKDLFYLEFSKANILIRCPHCHKCALIRSTSYSDSKRKWTADCFCSHCVKEWPFRPGGHAIHDSQPHRYIPLWLQTNCCEEILWAFNQKHLEFLEKYVSQALRKRPHNFNGSLQSRLPKWILSAKNREAVLRGIKCLKVKLPAS